MRENKNSDGKLVGNGREKGGRLKQSWMNRINHFSMTGRCSGPRTMTFQYGRPLERHS